MRLGLSLIRQKRVADALGKLREAAGLEPERAALRLCLRHRVA